MTFTNGIYKEDTFAFKISHVVHKMHTDVMDGTKNHLKP